MKRKQQYIDEYGNIYHYNVKKKFKYIPELWDDDDDDENIDLFIIDKNIDECIQADRIDIKIKNGSYVKLGEGMQGKIYDIGNNQIIKIGLFHFNERIAQIASNTDISPKYYGKFSCRKTTYYIQEKLPFDYLDLYISQIPELLTRMIEAGIFHNDIKKANMMANKEGKLYLIDFDFGTLISDYGYEDFDKRLKNIRNEEECLENCLIPKFSFTIEQLKRIYKMRPSIQYSQNELQNKNKLKLAKEKIRQEQAERLKNKKFNK